MNCEINGNVPEIQTVYCIVLEGGAVGGVDWFFDADMRTTKHYDSNDVWFDLDVPKDASKADITKLADDAMWAKSYQDGRPGCRLVDRELPGVLKLVRTDPDNCRVYYKSAGTLYAFQRERADHFRLFECTPAGEPMLPVPMKAINRRPDDFPEFGRWMDAYVKSLQIRLWVALVEHESVPSTRPVLIAQANEPGDTEILARLASEADASELRVVGVFDLSHAISVDALSKDALGQYVRSAKVESTAKEKVAKQGVPSVFDTMVPWGLNRSPVGPSM